MTGNITKEYHRKSIWPPSGFVDILGGGGICFENNKDIAVNLLEHENVVH
jgi:hypothetical protein